MNNIQKAFKTKARLGLRMAAGGLLAEKPSEVMGGVGLLQDQMQQKEINPQSLLGMTPDERDNAEKTKRWGLQDVARQAKYSDDLGERRGLFQALTQGAGDYNKLFNKPLELADGGVLEKETPDQLMARMTAKYGAPAAGPQPVAPTPQPAAPAPQPAPVAPPPKPAGFFGGLRQALDPARRERAAGLAEGGIVRGKGGPTDDAVPMTVAGKDVNLSNTEAVLPAKTVEALGGPAAVEKLIEQTNGKPPVKTGLRAGGDYSEGVVTQRPWYAGTDSRDERTGLEMERERRAANPTITNDPVKQVLMTGTLGAGSPTAPSTNYGNEGRSVPAPVVAPATPPAAAPVAPTSLAAGKNGNLPGQTHLPEAVSYGEHQAAGAIANAVDQATGVSRAGNQGLRGMAQRFDTYVNNDTARDARNTQERLRGSGARFEKGTDGKLMITNSGDFDGSTKMAYTDKDGNPTAKHEGSQQNLQGIKDAQGLRKQLANIEQMNLERNAKDDITDLGLRAQSQATLDKQGAQAAALAAKAPNTLDIAKFNLDVAKHENDKNNVAQMQANNMRDFKAKQSAQVAARTEKMLDNIAPTAGLKDAELKTAQARRADLEQAFFSAHKRQPGDDDEYAAEAPRMMDQARLSVAMRDAIKNRGFLNKLGNLGKDPWTTLHAAKPTVNGKDFVFENGFSIPIKDVIGDDADLLAAYKARVQQN